MLRWRVGLKAVGELAGVYGNRMKLPGSFQELGLLQLRGQHVRSGGAAAKGRRMWGAASVVAMAQPNPKGPTKTVKIYCMKCKALLYKYRKGGKGSLVKCWHERIVEDHTAGDLRCPSCGSEFARPAMIRGKPANKIIGGKVIMKK